MDTEKKGHSHRAKKSLGQNFLKSPHVISTFVRSAEMKEGDLAVELGPGKGAITKALLRDGVRVFAIEKDKDLIPFLKEKFNEEVGAGQLTVHEGDILDFDPKALGIKAPYYIIGSIPYYITSIIIRTCLEATPQPKTIALVIQKEVAERIVSRDGKESILSLSVKAYGEPSYVKTIKAKEFSPIPKVDSAILTIGDISRDFFTGFSEEEFFTAVREGFKQKRKKMLSNLSGVYDKKILEEVFDALSLSHDLRAEDVELSQWGDILKEVKKRM